MATRENQGLQIALIIFLMITVGLAISTYYYFRQAEEQAKFAADSDAKAKVADTLAKSRAYQLQALKLMIGVPNITPETVAAAKQGIQPDEGTKEIDIIKKDFDADMAMFDDTIPVENRNWRTLPRFLYTGLMKRSAEVAKATEAEKTLIKEKADVITTEQGRVKIAMDGLTAAKDDIKKVGDDFVSQVTTSNKQKTDLEDQLKKNGQEYSAKIAELDKKIINQNESLKKQATERVALSTKIKDLTNETFERAHGKITFVNLRSNTVYINLGRADGLQRQITFSVYDPGVNTLEVPNAALLKEGEDEAADKPKRKASIEVIDVLDEHLAEARILDDAIKNPILPGDNIFTPAWRPGQKLEFALVGKLDLDGDNVSDAEKIKNLIMANGGKITCELPENAKEPIGRITVNTRFLVVGDRLNEVADDKVRAAFTNMIGAAEVNGVQQVAVKDLLTMMGWKGTDRTVKLGSAGAADLEKKKDDTKFRPRPKPAAEKAAF